MLLLYNYMYIIMYYVVYIIITIEFLVIVYSQKECIAIAY